MIFILRIIQRVRHLWSLSYKSDIDTSSTYTDRLTSFVDIYTDKVKDEYSSEYWCKKEYLFAYFTIRVVFQVHNTDREGISHPRRLSNKISNEAREYEDRDNSYSDIVKDFLRSTTFEFSEIIRIRDDRKSRTFCLHPDKDDDDNRNNRKKNSHKMYVKIAPIIWNSSLFANFWLFLDFMLVYIYKTHSMKYLFSLPLIFLSSIISVFADENLTSSGFMLSLSAMDPVNHNQGNSDIWVNALLFVLWRVADMLLFIIPILGGISLMIAGYYYLFSGWDTEKASQAKTIIKWNIIAIAVAFLSYALVNIVLYIMNL